MAGIGFNLKKILEAGTYRSTFETYFISSLIVAGPWILSIITLFVLSTFIPYTIDMFDKIFFRTVVIYGFVTSLILSGVFHFPLTRYLADRLYSKEKDALVPAFNTTAVCLFGIETLFGVVFYVIADSPPALKLLIICTYMILSLLWLLMVFLTALRDYLAIVAAYIIGSGVTIVVSLYLGQRIGIEGYFIGYLSGHLMIALLWSGRIFVEFGSTHSWDWEYVRFFINNRTLIAIGFFYNLALWIDKVILWFSPQATEITNFFRIHLVYDSATFFAFLTIIPALTIFLVQVETNFYDEYRNFYQGISKKATYPQIEWLKKDVIKSLQSGLKILIRYQGILTFLILIFTPELSTFFHFSAEQIPVFRVVVIGSFLHCMILIALILVLYFDFKSLALQICVFFVLSNGLLTYLSTKLEIAYLGYGYLASAFLTLAFAFYAFDRKLYLLEYYTFALQPVAQHRQEGLG